MLLQGSGQTFACRNHCHGSQFSQFNLEQPDFTERYKTDGFLQTTSCSKWRLSCLGKELASTPLMCLVELDQCSVKQEPRLRAVPCRALWSQGCMPGATGRALSGQDKAAPSASRASCSFTCSRARWADLSFPQSIWHFRFLFLDYFLRRFQEQVNAKEAKKTPDPRSVLKFWFEERSCSLWLDHHDY